MAQASWQRPTSPMTRQPVCFPALLPALAARFRLEAADLALLVSVFAVSTSLPQPLFGALADRLGRRRVARSLSWPCCWAVRSYALPRLPLGRYRRTSEGGS